MVSYLIKYWKFQSLPEAYVNQTWRLLRNCRNCVPDEMTPRRYFSAFPRTSSIILPEEVAWTTQVFSSREKADTVSDGITSSPSSHHLSPTPTNVVCSLVALLALLASFLLIISSLFRFHEIPFCKFECFPCNFSRDHSALKENYYTRMVTLASWPQKTRV